MRIRRHEFIFAAKISGFLAILCRIAPENLRNREKKI
jgi:hypothetical protein